MQAAADSATGTDRDVLLTQVARAFGLTGDSQSATEVLDQLPTDDAEVDVRVELENARMLNSVGESAHARRLLAAALTRAKSAGFENLAIDALHMLAIVSAPDQQDEFNRRALEIAAAADDPRARRWRASLLNNMGWTAFDRADYSEALALFQEALEARLEHGKTSEVQVARWCVARTLRALGRVPEALEIQRSLAAEHAAAGTSDQYVDEETEACERVLASHQDHA